MPPRRPLRRPGLTARARRWLNELSTLKKVLVTLMAIAAALGTSVVSVSKGVMWVDARYAKAGEPEKVEQRVIQQQQQMQKELNQKVDSVQVLILQNRARDLRRRIRDFEELTQKRALARPELDTLDDLRDELASIKTTLDKLQGR